MDELFNSVVDLLKDVPGIEAIVLGGSRARGTQVPGSDIDIGLYYDADRIDLPMLNAAAARLDDEHRSDLVAAPGGWGNWVNGGGWLIVGGEHLDLILRDLARVQKVVDECDAGIVNAHYQPGHPHAFINVMYRGELAICRPLWARDEGFFTWKSQAECYPARMKSELLNLFGFEMGFSATLAENYSKKNDLYYVSAHVVRSISCLNQVLFALNEQYCLNEKKAVRMIENFPLHPHDYSARVDKILAALGTDAARACDLLHDLIKESNRLMSEN